MFRRPFRHLTDEDLESRYQEMAQQAHELARDRYPSLAADVRRSLAIYADEIDVRKRNKKR